MKDYGQQGRTMIQILLPTLLAGCANENIQTTTAEQPIQTQPVEDSERAWANEYLQSMTELIGNEPVYRDLNAVEAEVLHIEKGFFLPFERLFKGDSVPSADTLEAFLSNAIGQSSLSWSALPLNEGSLENLKRASSSEMHIDTEGDYSFATFLQSVATVDAFQWDIFDAHFTPRSNQKRSFSLSALICGHSPKTALSSASTTGPPCK